MTVNKPYIMICEDCDISAEMIESALRDMFVTHRVRDGRAALDYLNGNQPPILFLLDITMPGMSGIDVCRQIKDSNTTKAIPVIFITSSAGPISEVAGFDVGAVDYITKPISFPVLQARVRTHVELCSAMKSAEATRSRKLYTLIAVLVCFTLGLLIA